MSQRCFYCHLDVEPHEAHRVTFNIMEEEREEILCEECYKEWLEGTKG